MTHVLQLSFRPTTLQVAYLRHAMEVLAHFKATRNSPAFAAAPATAAFGKSTIRIDRNYTDFAAFFQKKMSERNREEDNEDEVPLHYILEIFLVTMNMYPGTKSRLYCFKHRK